MARPLANDHSDKRQAILKTAARLFAKEGYGRASMSSLAAACGISKANIYHYYPSKEALLFDILDTHLRALRDRICGLLFDNPTPQDQLRIIITEVLMAYEGADAEHELQLSATSALPQEQQKVLRRYQRDLVEFAQARIAQIAPPDVAREGGTLRALTMSVFAMLNWHYQWNSGADETARRDYATLVADLVLGGLPSTSRGNDGAPKSVTRNDYF